MAARSRRAAPARNAICRPATAIRNPPASRGCPRTTSVRQMAAFKTGQRANARAGVMIAMAQVLSDEEVNAAAEYFAKLKPTAGYNKVVETDTVPKSYVGAGGMRFAAADGGTEPIGERIIVLPMDAKEAELARSAFRIHRLRAERQHRQRRGVGGRRRRQDHSMHVATGPSSTATARSRPSPARRRPTSSASSMTSRRERVAASALRS